ncbi:MAG TPA: hypothetical protein VG324_21010, partial [Blastocatellia bacterium]|nr:hypothetical protein [Blastocatellia bacterium]
PQERSLLASSRPISTAHSPWRASGLQSAATRTYLSDQERPILTDAVEKGFWPPEKAILIQRHGPRRNIDSRGAVCRF